MSKGREQSSCPICGVSRTDILRHVHRNHASSLEEAHVLLGIPYKGSSIPCPVCGKICSRVKGAIIKHMQAAHSLSLEDARAKIGMVCVKCSQPIPKERHDSQYCSRECGKVGSKESSRRKILDQTEEQKKQRLRRYYETMESRSGRPVSPEAITQYVKSLGFRFRAPYTKSTDKMQLICLKGHNFERIWTLFRDYPTCTVCGKIDRFYTVEKVNNRLRHLGYDLLTTDDFENGIVPGTYPLSVKCKHGHIYETPCMYILRDQQVCPICNKSNEEIEIAKILSDRGFTVETGDRSIAKPYEIDIVIPDQKLCVEFCGLFWHSERFRPDRMYHLKKLEACRSKGYRLLTVFSDEWKNREDVCVRRMLHALGSGADPVGARKCEIVEVSKKEAQDFFNKHHLQGSSGSKVAWALTYKNELVQCLSLGSLTRQHTSKGRVIELKRLASASSIRVQGGLSRLLKRASVWSRENGYESIKTYCDLRWGTGESYQKAGFRLQATSKPSPWYTDGHRRVHAATMRKKPHERSSGKTEAQLRREQGYWRIWDCGHQTWLFPVKIP